MWWLFVHVYFGDEIIGDDQEIEIGDNFNFYFEIKIVNFWFRGEFNVIYLF